MEEEAKCIVSPVESPHPLPIGLLKAAVDSGIVFLICFAISLFDWEATPILGSLIIITSPATLKVQHSGLTEQCPGECWTQPC